MCLHFSLSTFSSSLLAFHFSSFTYSTKVGYLPFLMALNKSPLASQAQAPALQAVCPFAGLKILKKNINTW